MGSGISPGVNISLFPNPPWIGLPTARSLQEMLWRGGGNVATIQHPSPEPGD
jgi:hypothetical protein